MRKNIFVIILSVISAVCIAAGISACGGAKSETYSTLEMEDGVVYLTDFSLKYTSEEDSPNGDVKEDLLKENITGSKQIYFLVMDFNMQMAEKNYNMETFTVAFSVLDASVVDCTIDSANTSSTTEITSDGQTVITATYTLPEKAKLIKNVRIVIELKPYNTGRTDIVYSFSADDKQITGYENKDTTYTLTSSAVTISKTSLEYTLNDEGTGYTVTGIGSKSSIACIKDTYNGLPVTAIGNSAFKSSTSLTKITIPNSVTAIGNNAFTDCYKLVEVYNLSSLDVTAGSSKNGNVAYYAKNVYTAADGKSHLSYKDDYLFVYDDNNNYYLVAYYGSDSEITLPSLVDDSNKTINYAVNQYAFYKNTTFTDITIPDTVTSIQNHAFGSCSKIKSVTMGNAVKSIGDYAFNGCTALASVTISENLTSIGYGAFRECTSLANINIPDSVTTIGSSAFYHCTSLLSITIGDGVTAIGSNAFENCTSITEAIIGDGVTTIGSGAFEGCSSLSKITIGNSVTSIESWAFSYTAITSITIPGSVTSIGYYVFSECSSLKNIIFSNTSGWYVSENSYTSGNKISTDEIASFSKMASYLTDKYSGYYWYRSDN